MTVIMMMTTMEMVIREALSQQTWWSDLVVIDISKAVLLTSQQSTVSCQPVRTVHCIYHQLLTVTTHTLIIENGSEVMTIKVVQSHGHNDEWTRAQLLLTWPNNNAQLITQIQQSSGQFCFRFSSTSPVNITTNCISSASRSFSHTAKPCKNS